ncbi:MAG: UDP-N-acetylglucosamine 4,6-dehydratase (inverting) [Alphaproteobacteria bacterium]
MRSDFSSGAFDLNGRSILVTGGTGSFGQAFARIALARFKPKRLVIFSRDELKQHDMALALPQSLHPSLRYFIGDVRDADRLEFAMHGIDTVVHTAALKQIVAAEYNPFECIRTNVHGAENVVRASLRAGVERVIALSTDKAANPINLYGASKLASDKIFVAANHLGARRHCRFSVVRYGNVVGSRGSVIPLFDRLIAGGARTLPITDPRMTRFWITLRQGVNFVLSCLGMMQGGEIFVPRIPSMSLIDVAKALAPTLGHDVVGIRPGEKLHEVMITGDDARWTVSLPDRYAILPSLIEWRSNPVVHVGSRPVAEDFVYASNTNDDWLEPGELRALVGDRIEQDR